ncbi:30S ribosomal protein S16 [Azoarcus sp. KH32C]|nr:30S ribosomal protein S16 [Azoarcus sp. KH32C]
MLTILFKNGPNMGAPHYHTAYGTRLDRTVEERPVSALVHRPLFPYNCLLFAPIYQDTQMVVIRLARGGAKKRPFYNIVAADSRNRRDGRFIERVGFYNPMASSSAQGLVINAERLAFWQQNGAQLSPTVARLAKQAAKAA